MVRAAFTKCIGPAWEQLALAQTACMRSLHSRTTHGCREQCLCPQIMVSIERKMITKLLTLIALAAIFVAGCKRSDVPHLLKQQPNASGSFALIYEGDQVGNQVFPRAIYLESATKGRTHFEPKDPLSIEQSAFFVQPAWSPNNDWLVLPNGRFDGFVTFKAIEIPGGIVDKSKGQFIGICDVNETKWWHEFDGWSSASVFRFKAGLSGKLFPFECDLSTGTVRATGNPPVSFRLLSK